jgi:hypothetical protein
MEPHGQRGRLKGRPAVLRLERQDGDSGVDERRDDADCGANLADDLLRALSYGRGFSAPIYVAAQARGPPPARDPRTRTRRTGDGRDALKKYY